MAGYPLRFTPGMLRDKPALLMLLNIWRVTNPTYYFAIIATSNKKLPRPRGSLYPGQVDRVILFACLLYRTCATDMFDNLWGANVIDRSCAADRCGQFIFHAQGRAACSADVHIGRHTGQLRCIKTAKPTDGELDLISRTISRDTACAALYTFKLAGIQPFEDHFTGATEYHLQIVRFQILNLQLAGA